MSQTGRWHLARHFKPTFGHPQIIGRSGCLTAKARLRMGAMRLRTDPHLIRRPALLVWLMARVDNKAPADCAPARRMLMVVLRRKRLIVVDRSLSTADDAQIDAGKWCNLSRRMILVEFVRSRLGDIALMLV